MKTIIRWMTLFFILTRLTPAQVLTDWPEAKVTVRVVGEDAVVITNATVHIGFSQGGNAWIGEHKWQTFHGSSDVNGCYSAHAKSEMSVGGSVEKDGYYTSFWEYTFNGDDQKIRRWQPWNPTVTVVLRKIGNPIPMYVKRVEMQIPLLNEPVGFDMGIGDWVAPYGKGQAADLMFTMKRRYVAWEDFDIQLTVFFPNKGDGIQSLCNEWAQGSLLRHERFAPENAYVPEWITEVSNTPSGRKGMEGAKGWYLVFRIQTRTDEAGKIKTAKYGRIAAGFKITGFAVDNPTIGFTYYLNPTPNDRNLEFDPKRNLFTHLKSTEQVTAP
jgi:hypothetical protein